eukprot:6445-Heterococcus_DN1.PRE.1
MLVNLGCFCASAAAAAVSAALAAAKTRQNGFALAVRSHSYPLRLVCRRYSTVRLQYNFETARPECLHARAELNC